MSAINSSVFKYLAGEIVARCCVETPLVLSTQRPWRFSAGLAESDQDTMVGRLRENGRGPLREIPPTLLLSESYEYRLGMQVYGEGHGDAGLYHFFQLDDLGSGCVAAIDYGKSMIC